MTGDSLVKVVKNGTAAKLSTNPGLSLPASNNTTLCPAFARLQARGPPPGPEPTTMYSTGASGGNEFGDGPGCFSANSRLVPAVMAATALPNPNFRNDRRDRRTAASLRRSSSRNIIAGPPDRQ